MGFLVDLNENKKIYDVYSRMVVEKEEGDVMDKDLFAKFEEKIVRAKILLFKNYPFFGIMLTKLKTVPTTDISTMAVDDNGNIYINPNFVVNTLTSDEVVGVLAHEVMHIMTLSFFRLRGRNPKLWNVATDYIMNRDLLEIGLALPSIGLIPNQVGDKWIIGDPSLGKINIDITNETSEGLYTILEQIVEKEASKHNNTSEDSKGSDSGKSSQPFNGSGNISEKLSKKQEELDKHLGPGEKPKAQKVPSDNPSYQPNDVNEGGTNEKSANQKKAEHLEKVQSTIDELEKNMGDSAEHTRGKGGSIPRSWNKDKILRSKTNWKVILKQFIKGSSSSYSDWARPHKTLYANGMYAPSTRHEISDIDAIIAIDTSGSISPNILNTFIQELIAILKNYKNTRIDLLLWTDTVYHEVEINSRKKSLAEIEKDLKALPYQSGGTNLTSVTKYIENKFKNNSKGISKISGILYFTDGEVEDNPTLPPIKNKIFMLNEDGNDKIVKKYGKAFFVDVEVSN